MKKVFRVGCLSVLGLVILVAISAKIYTRGQSEAIYDAVVRHYGQNDPDHHRIYFLAINLHDPSPSLLKRLEDSGYSIRKRSDAKADPTGFSVLDVVDKTTNEKGRVISLNGFFWYSPSRVMVYASDGGYVAEKRGSRWYVTDRLLYGG
jgi:hypothetical protein